MGAGAGRPRFPSQLCNWRPASLASDQLFRVCFCLHIRPPRGGAGNKPLDHHKAQATCQHHIEGPQGAVMLKPMMDVDGRLGATLLLLSSQCRWGAGHQTGHHHYGFVIVHPCSGHLTTTDSWQDLYCHLCSQRRDWAPGPRYRAAGRQPPDFRALI